MEVEKFFGSSYNGTKRFTQRDVATANATGFGAAADDWSLFHQLERDVVVCGPYST